MKTEVTFKKFDAAKQQVYAEVYLPMVADSQNDFMTAEDIEGIAHDFMGNVRVRNIDTNHDGVSNGSFAIESFIAKADDKTFVPGAWVLGLKVPNPNLWAKIEAGELKGLSMQGDGSRTETVLKGKPANRLEDVTIHSVSIVRKGANQQDFKIMKQDSTQALADTFAAIAASITKTNTAIAGIAAQLKTQDAKIASLSKGADGQVYKAAPVNTNAAAIERQLRKRERAQQRLDSFWERPDMFPDTSESELRRAVQKAEDKLYEYGHQHDAATLDTGSAFLLRGGRSDFLVASPSTLDDVLGINASRGINKSDEDSIQVENCLIL